MIGLTLETAPLEEPVTLAEAKLHLRIDLGETSPVTEHPEDSLITILIKAARRWAESFQNRAYVTQTWKLYLDAFPTVNYILIPKPPLQYVASLSYKDAGGVLQTISFLDPSGGGLLEADDYVVDVAQEPGRLCLKNGSSWPATITEAQAVVIEFVAGNLDKDSVPEEVKAAILMKVSDLYENRGDVEAGSRFELAAKALLWANRVVPI